MTQYFTRRLLHATLLLLGVSIFSFALLQLAPGDFFAPLKMNPQISARTVEGLRAQYGLDQPLPVRYGRWLRATFHGDLGPSFSSNSPVAPLLALRARNTLLLTGTAILLAWLIAIPLGIISAVQRGKWSDRAGGVVTSALLTIPDLVLFLTILLLAVRTGWFPTGGMASTAFGELSAWGKTKDIAHHLFLPSLGLAIATLLSASLLVEVILSWPGIGPLLLDAILAKDVYVVMGTVMFSAVFLVLGNLVADLLLFAVDPRIRMES